MSIPLVQENTKDAINTSIIAIKRNIERINTLLGLVDNDSPDLSGFATKQELQDAVTQVETDLAPVDEVTLNNMHSVTSNAVANALIKEKKYTFTRTVTTTQQTGFTLNNFQSIDISELSQKNIICATVNTDWAWVVSSANIANNKTSLQCTWAYVTPMYGSSVEVTFTATLFYYD